MPKKLHILFRRGLDTQFCKRTDYERAKELYIINFGNHITMKKNGELKEYSKFNVSEDTEYKWSLELKEKLIKEIQSDNNFTQVVQLARVNLPKNEILDAFESLASSSIKDDILSTIEQLKPLFEADMYIKIIKLFK